MDRKQILEENKKIRHLQIMVHLTMQILYQSEGLTAAEGLQYIKRARQYATSLFPGKGDVFDLIYRTRLLRILHERGILEPFQN